MPSSQKKQALLGSHQKCWIWGRHLVETTLASGIWPVLELQVSSRLPVERTEHLRRLAQRHRVPMTVVAPAQIERVCRAPDHQGMAAKMPPFPYRDPDTIIRQRNNDRPLLLLDGIQDAYNFGAIIRSADVLGVRGICIAGRGQVGVTSMVARASAGAINHVPIYRIADPAAFLEHLRQQQFQVIGASEKGEAAPDAVDWSRPTILIMGNEGRGIQAELLSQCDRLTRIPHRPQSVPSLNVAAAAAILLYEAGQRRRQRISG